MNKFLRFSLVALMAIVFGNVYAAQVTMKYTGSETTNMGEGNNAALVGLDASAWSVIADKGAHEQFPGLNKAGDFRLYWKAEGSNTITVSSLTGATINSIKLTFTGETYSNVTVTVGGNAVSGTDGTYAINSSSFVLGNGNTKSAQVRITELVINYTPASSGGGGGGEGGSKESYTAITADGSSVATEFANPTAEGTDLIVNVSTANVTLKAVASKTPARSQTEGMTEATWDTWNDAKWDGPKKQNDIKFYWIVGTGNPYISFQSKTIMKDDKPTGDYDPDYSYYQPDGSVGLPKSGEYIEITSKVDGMLKIGFWANKGASRKLYLIDKETQKALTWDADPTKTQYKVEGYVNGWDEEYVEEVEGVKTKKAKKRFIPYMQVNDYVLGDPAAVNDKVLDDEFQPTTKTVDQVGNAVKFGWFVFDAKANKTYMVFGSDWQFGFQGFEFTPGAVISDYNASDPSGIEAITSKANTNNANAPMYNLSGQKVDKSYKGIVIQNGRKYMNK